MASIRKVLLKPKKDGTRSARWVVDWTNENGRREEKHFRTKRAAEDFRAERHLDPQTADKRLVRDAADAFLDWFEGLVSKGERRRSTYEQKRQHIIFHLFEFKLSKKVMRDATAADIQEFFDELLSAGRSVALTRKIAATIHQLWAWSALRSFKADAAAAVLAKVDARRSAESGRAEIPPKHHCRAMLEAADERAEIDRGRSAALFRVAMLGGLRAGEMRALRWIDLDLSGNNQKAHISRSADKYGEIHDTPKSKAGNRSVPLSPATVHALKAWKLACPPSAGGLVFPNEDGGLWDHSHLNRNCWVPVMRAAGLAKASGKGPLRKHPKGNYRPTVWEADYTPHKARHIAASIWIAEGASRQWIKEKMGHSTMKLVDDLYGHLWPDVEEDSRMAAAVDRAFD